MREREKEMTQDMGSFQPFSTGGMLAVALSSFMLRSDTPHVNEFPIVFDRYPREGKLSCR